MCTLLSRSRYVGDRLHDLFYEALGKHHRLRIKR